MRSGTTLLQRVLSTHGAIGLFKGELRALMWPQEPGWSHAGRVLFHLLKEPVWRRPVDFRREVYRYLHAFLKSNGVWRRPGYEGIRQAFELTLAAPENMYVGDKHPQYLQHISELSEQSGVRCITVLRDPRGVVSSLLRTIHEGYWKGKSWTRAYATLEQCCEYWNREAQTVLQLRKSRGNSHLVMYNEFVNQPLEVLHELAAFLDLDVADFDFAEVHTRSIGRYHHYLSAQQIAEVEERTGEFMSAFGFD